MLTDYGSFWTAYDVDSSSQRSQPATFVTVTSDGLSVGINPDDESFYDSGFVTQKSIAGPFDASLWLPDRTGLSAVGSVNSGSGNARLSDDFSGASLSDVAAPDQRAADIDPTPPNNAPIATPEPSTLGLLAISLGCSLLLERLRALARP
jgi:hypothetical protein